MPQFASRSLRTDELPSGIGSELNAYNCPRRLRALRAFRPFEATAAALCRT
jgi:hypothetical protein